MPDNLITQLHRLEKKHQRKQKRAANETATKCSQLKVFYGWAKLNKIRKREAISIIFENEAGAGEHHRMGKALQKSQETVFVRNQTEEEAKDAAAHNRVFTEYSIFLDDKAVNGDLEKALDINDEADKNHVSQETRQQIRQALRQHYVLHHKMACSNNT